MILTVDLGTTVVKAAVWADHGLVSIGRAPLVTNHPHVGWAEQDPKTWWPAVVNACAPLPNAEIEAIGFSCARQTFVLVDRGMQPVSPGVLWSDQRGSVADKLAWLQDHDVPHGRWLLNPRDFIASRMTGRVATDWTVASSSGLYEHDGAPRQADDRLPPVLPPTAVVGELQREAASELGLSPGTPVVIGAGDRQCEVLGVAATTERPMVSWGTTANVSVPARTYPKPRPEGLLVHGAAPDGWLVEGGLSAAGSLIAWFAGVTQTTPLGLMADARTSPPAARGVIVLPWLGGARAPWWRPDAAAAVLGLRPAHTRADIARAAIEGVAWEVERCLRAATSEPRALALTGGGASDPVWLSALTGITGLPAIRRASDEGASAGAALLTAIAVGRELDVDVLNPVRGMCEPAHTAAYAAARGDIERATNAVLS